MPPKYASPYGPGGDDGTNNGNPSLEPALFQNDNWIAQTAANQQQQQQQALRQREDVAWQNLQQPLPQHFWFSETLQRQALGNFAQQTQSEYLERSVLDQQPVITNELDVIQQNTGSAPWSFTHSQLEGQGAFGQQGRSYQDVPLYEQQAPIDMYTQSFVPPLVLQQPVKQPTFYDDSIDQGNLYKPSSTDNYPYYDDGPVRKDEEITPQAHQRIFRAQFAMRLEMRPVYPPVQNKQQDETTKDFFARKRHRENLLQIQEKIHARKMNPSDEKYYDAAYTREWQRQQKDRRERNASRRAAVLAWRRVWDQNLNPQRPRATTPEFNDNGPNDNMYSEDFFVYTSGNRRTIALEEKRRQEKYKDYAQQPPVTGLRTLPVSTRCGPCIFYGYKGLAACDLSDIGKYPCGNCQRRGLYCHIDTREETAEQRVVNEYKKQKKAERAERKRIKHMAHKQKRNAEVAGIQEGQGGGATTFTQLPLGRRGREELPVGTSDKAPAGQVLARGRSASPQRRACTQCTSMGLPRHCDGSKPCSVCAELKRAELCRYETEIGDNVFGEVFSPGDFDDLYSASPRRSLGTRREPDLFDAALQDAMASLNPMVESGSPQLSGQGTSPFGALSLRQRPQAQAYITPAQGVAYAAPQSLDFSAQTQVAATTDAQHGFGGNPEYNRADQELENAKSAWDQGGEPESYVPQFDAQDFGGYEVPLPMQQDNQELNSVLPSQKIAFSAPTVSLPSKVTLRWDGNPAPVGPVPDGNIFPDIPKLRYYWMDKENGIPDGFQDGAAGDCWEIVPSFGNAGLFGVEPAICMTGPAKACDHSGHSLAWWYTCRDCHQNQNSYVRNTQAVEIERTKARLCKSCTKKAKQSPTAVLGWCLCSSQLRTSWLCHEDRQAAILILGAHNTLMKVHIVRAGQGRDNFCIGCYVNDADPQSSAWGCLACREWVVEDPSLDRETHQFGSRLGNVFEQPQIPYYQAVKRRGVI